MKVFDRREVIKMSASLALVRPALGAELRASESAKVGASRQSVPSSDFVSIAESLKPTLHETSQPVLRLVRPVADSTQYLRWRMEPEGDPALLKDRVMRKDDVVLLDFGGHRAGHLAFRLVGKGRSIDSPTRLRITFGEVPGDVAEPLYPYKGQLSSAWLPDEIVNIDFLPQEVRLPRRYAFRYVKIQVIDTSPNYGVSFEDVRAIALSSATATPPALPASAPEWVRRVDEVSLATLRDCMQTTFEDGPRRDQRLWIGDMRLQAQANYVTFKNTALVKRCLYLFAGLPGPDGLLPACVFEKPAPLTTDTVIVDYAILYGAAVLDYVHASGDVATARALWPTVRRQLEIFAPGISADGLFTAPKGRWSFIDWSTALDKSASMQGVMLYGYRLALELGRLAGAEKDVAEYPAMIERLQGAARANFYDAAAKVCVSGPQRQVSWASQAWLTLAGGVLSEAESQEALRRAVIEDAKAIRPATPYLYHHVVEAMLQAGMQREALELIRSYWGSMVENGADTFWEAYDPKDSLFSPYGDVHINSFCHAWSCTPAYLFRSGRLPLG